MKTPQSDRCHPIVMALFCATAANAQPANFPAITVQNHLPAEVSPGRVFLAVASELPDVGYYVMIVNNDGSIAWSAEVNDDEIYDFKMLPNGQLHYAAFIEPHSWTGGGDAVHEILDENYENKETITGGNGYVAESHDFQLLPNGNVLQFGYYMSEVDMSQIVTGGHPAALVSGGVIQELDAQRNVIFQWRTWDHYPFAGNVTGTNAKINAFHINTIFKDFDGHIIIGTPQWVKKLNRQTGEIIWHLGGDENQFTFAGGGASGDFGGHAMNLLPNGHYVIYDNGGRGPSGAPSKAHEYILDQVNKVATRVWTYMSSPTIKAWHRGNAQRLANGNTMIGWGGASGAVIPTCTEVNATGQKVFEIFFNNPLVESYRAFRFNWPPEDKIACTLYELALGNTYVFTDPADPPAQTGVTIEVLAGGGGYNEFTVTREPYAPVDPVFQSTAPQVLPIRVRMNKQSLPVFNARISFDANILGLSQPEQLTIYYRQQPGQGTFTALPTNWNPATLQLRTEVSYDCTCSDFGEFVFGYPDLADAVYPPLLARPESYRGIQSHEVIAPPLTATGVTYAVNQERPVSLSWSPKGIARSYDFEIATSGNFATPEVQVTNRKLANYVWSEALPGLTYFYRVRTQNDAGASDWSVGSFQTVPPMVRVSSPDGSEELRRGLKYFIRWEDNLTESVVIDLYKDGVFLKTLATTSSAGAWEWEVGLDLEPGNDYSIRVGSSVDPTMFSISAASFSVDMPFIVPGSLIRLPDGRVQFGLTAPGSSQATVVVSTDLGLPIYLWQELQTLPLTNGSATFTDDDAANHPRRFYSVRVP